MTDLDHADRIMALPAGSYIVTAEPVNVTNIARGGLILLLPGDRVKITATTGQTAFGYTERGAHHVAFGLQQALAFDPAPAKA